MGGGRISRGWKLAKESWRVLRADRSLTVFPVISFVATIAAAIVIWTPGVILSVGDHKSKVPLYVAGVISAYVLTFIAVFFGTALAAAASKSLDGQDSSLSDGLSVARARLGKIVAWSFLQATVGLLLHALQNAGGDRGPGRIVAVIVSSLLGAGWAVVTFFVIPVLALEGLGPVDSIKRSWSVIKQRWGEAAVGTVSIGLVIVLLAILPVAALGGGGVLLISTAPAAGAALIAVAAIVLAAAILISTTLNSIFRVALYRFATTGDAGTGFDRALLEGAFAPRR